jgi:hypothetical protein
MVSPYPTTVSPTLRRLALWPGFQTRGLLKVYYHWFFCLPFCICPVNFVVQGTEDIPLQLLV